MITVSSIEAMIRECSIYEEHLSAQLADAEWNGADRVAPLIDLIDLFREIPYSTLELCAGISFSRDVGLLFEDYPSR